MQEEHKKQKKKKKTALMVSSVSGLWHTFDPAMGGEQLRSGLSD